MHTFYVLPKMKGRLLVFYFFFVKAAASPLRISLRKNVKNLSKLSAALKIDVRKTHAHK